MNTPVPVLKALSAGLQQAVEQGIIEPLAPREEHIPWPVMVLTFIGSLISAILFIAFFGLIALTFFQLGLSEHPAFFFVCGFFCIGVVVLLIKPRRHLYMEYLLFIMLIVGIGLITAGLLTGSFLREENVPLAISILCGLCASVLPMGWARAMGSFAAASGLYIYFQMPSFLGDSLSTGYPYALVLVLPGMAFIIIQQCIIREGRWRLALHLEPLLSGWMAAALITVAVSAGQTMFVGGFRPVSDLVPSIKNTTFDSLFSEYIRHPLTWITLATLPLAWWWSARRWKALRHWRVVALLLVMTIFSCIKPELALCLAPGIMTLATKRYRLAILALIAALWTVGALYYNLHMPLIHKAGWLAITGLILLILALAGKSLNNTGQKPSAAEAKKAITTFAARPMVSLALLALAAMVSFGGINSKIREQEQIRASGKQVLIELAPVDPRSLMQGDYMIVNFNIDPALAGAPPQAELFAYLDIDKNGVVHLSREAHEGEARIALSYRKNRWTVPASAWFFQEGDAKRWESARYGIFAVTSDGKSALVGMATADRKPIQ